MSMYRCVQLYLVPIPYDPNSVYMCLCLLSSKALGIEESEYVCIYMCRYKGSYIFLGASSL